MLFYILSGFLIGVLLPATSSRFGKILPADPGTIILQLWHKPRFPKSNCVARNRLLYKKWKILIVSSFLWGLSQSILFGLSKLYLPADLVVWGCILSVIVGYCFIVDAMYCLLPDFFTIPLLFLGFAMSVFSDAIPPQSSVIGAIFGYLIATISVVILGMRRRIEFGAGDAKMMTAIGAWLGVFGLNFALIISFFIFASQTTFQGRRWGAYGPALGLAGLIVFFILYAK
jgi:leader peptidase (prepilin peptidase)/N-methyltransferase